jgi:hypothetical protein
MKTEVGSSARLCGVYHNYFGGYFALACSRVVSFSRPDVLASIYNKTLKDIQDCLAPAGWRQTSED